jgi:glutamate---cysteine ligase / carboxylate-amine ligase
MAAAGGTGVPGTAVPGQMPEPAAGSELLSLGVEEEFLLVAADAPHAVGAVEDVFDQLPAELRDCVQHEYMRSQIEVASPPVVDLHDLWRSLARIRTGLADATEQIGARLVAVGASPAAGPATEVVDKPRYHRMVERFGALSPGNGLNGMHVHVGVPDPETGIQLLNHLRPVLPVLQAATANSPFAEGADTGYASWRSIMWERWPTVGPTPYLESHQHYEALLADLIASGAMLDEGMLYWYARLSARYPTIEIRIGDVCSTLDDTMFVAAMIRALVATVLRDVHAGVPAPQLPHALLVAAHWRAARDGLEGLGVDLATRQARPAWHLLRQLFDRVGPELERHGDLQMGTVLLGRLRRRGTGAARQRAVFAQQGDIADVVTWLAAQTRGEAR